MYRTLLASIVALGLLPSVSFSQDARAAGPISATRVNGTVTDPSGAVIVNAKVTFSTGSFVITTETIEDGSVHQTLPSGLYDVLISKAGFVNTEIKSLRAQTDAPASFIAVLHIHGRTIYDSFHGQRVEAPTWVADLPNRVLETPAFVPLALQPTTGRTGDLRYYSTCPDLGHAMLRSVVYVDAPEPELRRWATVKVFPKKTSHPETVHVQVQVEGEQVFCAEASNGPPEKQKSAVEAAMQWKFGKKRSDFKNDLVGTLTFQF
jgi:hypothetical protein